MGILLAIWKQFKSLIVFLLLEAIALGLIFSFNIYQNSLLFQSLTSIRGNFSSSLNLIDSYLNLYSENKQLVEENTRLSEALKNNSTLQINHAMRVSEKYKYIAAQVAYASIGLPENYLVLNKGSKQGVMPEMAVISSSGLIGIVYNVSDDYASVLPLINTSFSCLVAISEYTLSANTSWNGNDYRYINVKGVPLHLSIKKGDSIFTNKNSTLYPSHELIGTVENIEKEDLGKSFALTVKLATDFSKLKNVYIVKNKDKKQIDSLLNNE